MAKPATQFEDLLKRKTGKMVKFRIEVETDSILLIKILEDNGLKVRVCGNCRFFCAVYGGKNSRGCTPGCKYPSDSHEGHDYDFLTLTGMQTGCEHWDGNWAPKEKEVSGKPPVPPPGPEVTIEKGFPYIGSRRARGAAL